MRNLTWRKFGEEIQRLLLLTIGVVAAAIGYALFQVPYNLAAGGVSGIGIIVAHYTGFSPSLFYFIANVPLLLLGYWSLGGWRFLYRTILAVVGFTFLSEWMLAQLPGYLAGWPITDNILLASIYAGLIGGIGAGLIFLAGGTLGGTAIVARMIQSWTGIQISQIYLIVDGMIVITAGFVFGWEIALYSYLVLLLSGLATDYVLEGPSRTRTATIITTKPDEISQAIIQQLGRGVSFWEVTGGYTGEVRTLVHCTFYRQQLADLRRLVHDIDPKAFLTIGITQQAIGEGFIDPRKSIG